MKDDINDSDQEASNETGSAVSNILTGEQHPVTKLSGDKAQQVFQSLSNEPEYSQLRERVNERGEQLNPEDMTVIRMNGEKEAVLVDVPIVKADAEKAYLCIGRDEEANDVIAAALEYDMCQENDDNSFKRITFSIRSDTNSLDLEKRVRTIDTTVSYSNEK